MQALLKQDKKILLCLVLLLFVQAILMFYFADKKAGFFVDEICTYEAANYGDAPEGTNGLIWHNTMEQWYPGSFFSDALTASGDKRFDFSIGYHNQENDAHPPLYHIMINFISSLFPGELTKWIGIAPNIVFCIFISILLFSIAKNIFDEKLALIITAAWGLSVGCMSTAVFIRMYAMLTLECIFLVWLHIKLFNKLPHKIGLGLFATLFICTLLGSLTQYYFLIFAFFLCGFFTIFLFIQDKKICFEYVLCEFAAVLCAGLIFPRMWFQLFGGERGGEALANLASSEMYLEHFKSVCAIICSNLFGGKLFVIVVVFIILAVVLYFLQRNFLHCSIQANINGYVIKANMSFNRHIEFFLGNKALLYWLIGFAAAMYMVLVVKLAPYQVDRYYMCLYPLLVLLVAGFLYRALHYIIANKNIVRGIALCSFIVFVGIGYLTPSVSYVYADDAQRVETVSAYRDYPVILLNGLTFDAATDVYVFEYQYHPAVYRCRIGDYSGLANAAANYDLSNGFVLYAYWQREVGISDEDLFVRINEYLPIESYELISQIGCPVFFCIPQIR